jgi:hypothetical protein
MWTRVKTLQQMRKANVDVYSLQSDLNTDRAIAAIRKSLEEARSALLFDPEIYSANDPCLTVER